MRRYFKNNESYFQWLRNNNSKYNIIKVDLKEVKIKGEKNKKEGRVVVDYTIRVREDINMEFIKIYMMLDKKTQKLVDGLGRLRFKERKENLKKIRDNMEALKISPSYIDDFINDIKVTLDIR